MKVVLLLLWPATSILLLAAHFYRSGNDLAIWLCLLVLAALVIRRPWAVRIVQAGLVLGAAEWGRTTLMLAQARAEAGMPFLRLACILGGVMLFTLASTFVFRTPTIRRYYTRSTAPSPPKDSKPLDV